jgi:hypothetical protein
VLQPQSQVPAPRAPEFQEQLGATGLYVREVLEHLAAYARGYDELVPQVFDLVAHLLDALFEHVSPDSGNNAGDR